MSTEPKYPKKMTRRIPDVPGGLETVYAPPGFFLAPAEPALPDDIGIKSHHGWTQVVMRRLPEGQLNDDDDTAFMGTLAAARKDSPQRMPRAEAFSEHNRIVSTEPKYPKYRDSDKLGVSLIAPDGFYLLNAGETIQTGDLSTGSEDPADWAPVMHEELGGRVMRSWAWTYARRLPEGQVNDDDDSIVADTLAPDCYPPPAGDWEARIQAELVRAKQKFPQWPTDPVHAAAIVSEEAGELVRAVNEACYEPHKTNPARPLDAAITEAIQLGAMVWRFLESAGHYQIAPGPQHDQSN